MENNEELLERRRTIRLDMESVSLTVSYRDSDGNPVSAEVTCVDFAKGGILFSYASPLPIGTNITATLKDTHDDEIEFEGSVKRIDQLADGSCNIAIHIPYDFSE